MSVDDFSKILLVIVISISILGLSYQTMRLIGGFADSIKDLRKVLQAFGNLSDKLVVDYDFISSKAKKIVESISNFTTNIVDPLSKMLSFVGKFRGKKKKKDKEKDDFADVGAEEDGPE
ncbi:MAG: hypothetical protein ACE5DX_01995 [Candidatus Dojkabacteria bacterium]